MDGYYNSKYTISNLHRVYQNVNYPSQLEYMLTLVVDKVFHYGNIITQ